MPVVLAAALGFRWYLQRRARKKTLIQDDVAVSSARASTTTLPGRESRTDAADAREGAPPS